MAIFKCKMCGGNLEISAGMTVCECEYCGTAQTLPKSDNEQTLNMINRANHFRQQCEFDKAMEIYEKILGSAQNDSEVYWSIVLCRYGIEYVDDPATHKKIATCHRAQFTSILKDPDYLQAIELADPVQKDIYKREAEYIDGVQKGILEISNKEEPFDVFICYKESDENGKRTADSVLAQELYYQLVQEGFKVFFSRITLEDKLGTAYEPYIFAALNSSKVMVVVGTKPEYFNAVWVRNEWSRYLMLMKEHKEKTLIPAYKDMDPYDLPDALSMFQAQDMSKLGFMQDLIRGIKKIASAEVSVKETSEKPASGSESSGNIAPLLKRLAMFLEDEDYSSACEYCEKILDIDPENAQAYIYKFMSANKTADMNKISDLSAEIYGKDLNENAFLEVNEIKKAYRFGNKEIKAQLENYRIDGIYRYACSAMSGKKYADAKKVFLSLSDHKDSAAKAAECEEQLYALACSDMTDAKSYHDYVNVRSIFEDIIDYKDSREKISECNNNIYNYAKKVIETSADTAKLSFSKNVISEIKERMDVSELEKLYDEKLFLITVVPKYETAKEHFKNATTPEEFIKVAKEFEHIKDFPGSAEMAEKARRCSSELADLIQQEKELSRKKSKLKCEMEKFGILNVLRAPNAGKEMDEIDIKLTEIHRKIKSLNVE